MLFELRTGGVAAFQQAVLAPQARVVVILDGVVRPAWQALSNFGPLVA